jgi:type IV fimbrial biogenesis protein FimT
MLNLPSRKKTSGFSLIELMMAIVILVILISIGVPSFRTWLMNAQVRNAASSITSGLQRARAEAVTRNTNVSFTLGTDTSWTIDVVAPASQIESRPASEGSQNVTVSPSGPITITFGSLGIVAGGTARQFDFSAPGSSRNLRVTIGVSGNAKMCDPNGYGHTAC